MLEQLSELMRAIDKLGLNLGRQFIEERELKFHEIEVVKECLVDVLLYVVVQIRLNVVRLIGAFNFLDPNVKVVHSHLN